MKLSETEINQKLFEKFNASVTPSKQNMFAEIAAMRTRYLTIVMEDVYQSHNASAVMRTCDCFGIQDLHVIERKNKYKAHELIAKGSARWVDTIHHPKETTTKCLNDLKAKGYQIIATSPKAGSQSIYEIEIDHPMAFVFGTEGKGISDEAFQIADKLVNIPMLGFTDSLNVSASVSIIASVIRERLTKSNINWKLSEEEQIVLKTKWCKSILNGGEYMYERFLEEILINDPK